MPAPSAVPLVKLPNLVLFPGVYVVLHVGEPSFQELFSLAEREHGGYLCLALPCDGPPGVHTTGCVAQVTERRTHPTGDAVRLVGLFRLRLKVAIETAQATLVQGDRQLDEPPSDVERWTRGLDLLEALVKGLKVPARGSAPDPLWVESVAFHLPLEARFKQRLLEERDPLRRLETMVAWLTRLAPQATPN